MVWTGPHEAICTVAVSMEDDGTLSVGLDAHKDLITIAYAFGASLVELLGEIDTIWIAIDRL